MIAVESPNDSAIALVRKTDALTVPQSDAETLTPEEQAEFDRAVQRIESFPQEFGWLMIYVGVLGIVLPGVIGFPLVIAGGAVVMPGGRKWLARWLGRNNGRMVRSSLKQIVRMSDDLDRRYPRKPWIVR